MKTKDDPGPDRQPPSMADPSLDRMGTAMSAPGGQQEAADGPPPVPARAWGGADVSLWIKPRLGTREEKKRFFDPIKAAVVVVSLALAAGIGMKWGSTHGTVAFFAIALVLFVIGSVVRLGPREQQREVLVTVTDKVVRLLGDGANIALPLHGIVDFRVRDGARQGTTCFALHTDWAVVYIEVDSTAAASIIESLDRRVPSALTGSGLRPELGRRGRSLEEWREAVRSLPTQSGYRDGQPNLEHLLAAVRDERLGAEERIGAALALTARPDMTTREMLHEAANDVPNRPLRIALQHVADDVVDEHDIANALSVDGYRWLA